MIISLVTHFSSECRKRLAIDGVLCVISCLRRKCERSWSGSSRWVAVATHGRKMTRRCERRDIYRFVRWDFTRFVNVTKSDGRAFFHQWSRGYRAPRIDLLILLNAWIRSSSFVAIVSACRFLWDPSQDKGARGVTTCRQKSCPIRGNPSFSKRKKAARIVGLRTNPCCIYHLLRFRVLFLEINLKKAIDKLVFFLLNDRNLRKISRI